jgi:TfoX/Sxy family transcriptional regulator of competence genes
MVAKKMFGDYGIYCNGKIIGLICDNRFFLKPTENVHHLLRKEDMCPPYEGAKEYFHIEDVDDHEYLSMLVRETYKMLPDPKLKKIK